MVPVLGIKDVKTKTMVTRNDLFQEFYNEWKDYQPVGLIRMVFKSTSDNDLAFRFNLRVFDKGRFIV